ncbi:hypothetical protein [Acrocarpospora macrocephala]|nr:hypothetical protein [Acrocarpospora macrocephala]
MIRPPPPGRLRHFIGVRTTFSGVTGADAEAPSNGRGSLIMPSLVRRLPRIALIAAIRGIAAAIAAAPIHLAIWWIAHH